ncbi:DASH complex subunit DAM1 [Cryptococcus neoformans Bt1]|nr:DASH complex subunit DAM1 [Cryptococcus neoformans var. grubii Bt1]
MAPPHHPLRRISTGSLSSLARSTDKNTSSPSGLEFLQPAMTDLADEAATLAANTTQMTTLHDALGTFNEAFAAYLYALKMNAFCVEWPEAPNELSFSRAESLQKPAPPPPNPSASLDQSKS